MMPDNRSTILGVILSGLVLIAWQYFYNVPAMEKQRAAQQAQSELAKSATPAATPSTAPQTGAAPAPGAHAPAQPAASTLVGSRAAAVAASPRVKDETPLQTGSTSPKGARLHDLTP